MDSATEDENEYDDDDGEKEDPDFVAPRHIRHIAISDASAGVAPEDGTVPTTPNGSPQQVRRQYPKRTTRLRSPINAKLSRGHVVHEVKNKASSTPTMLDLSWKKSQTFVKSCSKVGDEHQATELPLPGTYEDEPNASEQYADLVWDPDEAQKALQLNSWNDESVLSKLPHNVLAQALPLFRKHQYDITADSTLQVELNKLKPDDGSNWSNGQKQKYFAEIFRLRKDMVELCQALDISMNECLAYYYGTFKPSDQYRIIKTVCREEEMRRAELEEFGRGTCGVCDDGGNLLICDHCEGEFHMTCMSPPLSQVPSGRWWCDDCINRKVLAARNYMICTSGLYEPINDAPSSMDVETKEGEGPKDNENAKDVDVVDIRPQYRPRPEAVAIVQKFADKVNAVFAARQEQQKEAAAVATSEQVQPMEAN